MADTTALKNRIRAAIKANDNQEITGPVLQQALLDIVDELDLNSELENEAQQRQNGDTQLNNLITGIKNNIDNGYVYAGIAIPTTSPVSGKVFYIATAAGTYTNFGGQVLTQGINILCFNGSAWSSQQLIGIDNEPTDGSHNLIESASAYTANRKIIGSKITKTIPSSQMIGIAIYDVKAGDTIRITIDSYAGSSEIKILGMIEFEPQEYDYLVNNCSQGNILKLNIQRDYKAIQIFKKDDTINPLTFTTEYTGLIEPISKLLFDDTYTLIKTESDNRIYDIRKGELYNISIDSYAGSSPIFVFGFYTEENYDTFANNLAQGDSISIPIEKDYLYLKIYKREAVEPLTCTVQRISSLNNTVVNTLTNTVYEKRSYTDITNNYVEPFMNVRIGESYKISIDSYNGSHKIAVLGYNSDEDYDFLPSNELKEGKFVIITLQNNYKSIRVVKRNDYDNQWSVSVTKIGLIQNEIEREIKPLYDELFFDKTDTITSTAQDNRIYDIHKGSLCNITIDSYAGSSPIFILGFYTNENYDTFADNLTQGDSISIPIEKDYLYLKIYKREAIEPLTYTVHAHSELNAKIAKNKQDIELNTAAISQNTTDIAALKNARKYAPFPYSAKIFMQVACVGDSYTAGYQKTEGAVVKTNENYAWPHYISNITGHKWLNFGVSGSSCKSWVDEKPNYNKMAELRAKKCQAYVIGLMINDSSSSSTQYVPLGTINDIGQTPGEGAGETNSYYAYYYALIQEILNINSKAIIFCNTCPKSGANYVSYNQAVRDIVAYCRNSGQTNVWLCDLYTNYLNSDYFTNSIFMSDAVDGHYTGIGYEFMAEAYVKVVSDVINANVASFQEVEAIPYDE